MSYQLADLRIGKALAGGEPADINLTLLRGELSQASAASR